MNEFAYKQGDTINFDTGSVSGTGIIKGSSTAPVPILGAGYIIEVVNSSQPIPNEVYPFDHMVVFEAHIRD